jgi:peptidoglycan/xylan/chitin deacetylase (PgdA/CDA1 family)
MVMSRRSRHRRGAGGRGRVGAAALVCLLVVAGCGGGDDDPTASGPTPVPTSSPTPSPTPTDSPAPTSSPTRSPTPTDSPSPTPSPVPTPSPSPSPSPSPTPTPPSPPPAADLVDAWWGLDVEAFDTSSRVVALTFDGGASNTGVEDILEALAGQGVPATFFVTGDFARAYPGSVRAMAAAGHPVGNHSNTHPSFPRSTNEEIRAELQAAEGAISSLTGVTTRPLFRFPFGDRTPLDIEVVNRAGYIPIRWTVDTLGWQGTTGGLSAAAVRQRVLDTARPGQVVLMHVGAHPEDGSTLDADALPGIIDALQDLGYGFVTVPELLAEGR